MLNNYHKKDRRILIFFLIITILSFSLFIGCNVIPANPGNPLGSLQIHSTPIGASIYLNGTHTGLTTPYTLENVVSGSLITLKLNGYLSSNNIIQILPNQQNILNVELTPNSYPPVSSYLTSIKIIPTSINLFTGQAVNITSITAYFSDGTNRNIQYPECTLLSINKEVATVSTSGKITGISNGETTIWAIYTENNVTKSDNILVNVFGSPVNTGNLTEISVLPSTILLSIGESQNISSITAYYDNGTQKNLNPDDCTISSNNPVVHIDNTGMITGTETGSAVVTVTFTEGEVTKSDTITVSVSETTINQPKYRALVIGIGDYIQYGEDGDLIAPPYDVNKMKELFYDCQFGPENTVFTKINELKNTQATKSAIFQRIQTTFSGATHDDVSYFYFSGHGATLNQVSYLCPSDFDGNTNTAISVDELENALSAIPGIKVVFIDSCHSGGFIGKNLGTDLIYPDEDENLNLFNENIIQAFTGKILSKGLLTSSEYQVLTSSHWYQSSYELYPPNQDPFGVFTQALYEGSSPDNGSPADTNMNNQISLNEAYQFITQWVAGMRVDQNVQVYPFNSPFHIFEY